MYELKKIGKVFTSKFVGTGPRLIKKNLPARGLTKVEKHCPTGNSFDLPTPHTWGINFTSPLLQTFML